MKKRLPAIFTAAVLLTSCAPSESGSQTSPNTESSAQTSVTSISQITTTSAPQTAAASDKTAAAETAQAPEQTDAADHAELTFVDEPIEMLPHSKVDKAKITKQLGYDIPMDVTALPEYEQVKRIAENHWEEEFRAEAERKNYLTINLGLAYLGTERADWLCSASYKFIEQMYPSVYRKTMYIKDGEITEFLSEEYNSLYFLSDFNGGKPLAIKDNALYTFDMQTEEFTKLTDFADEYTDIAYVSEAFILYGCGALYCYDRKTGEVTDTGMEWSCMESNDIIFVDDKIIYEVINSETLRTSEVRVRDLAAGEDRLHFNSSPMRRTVEGYDYYAEFYSVNDYYDITSVKITRKSDGAEKIFDLRGLPKEAADRLKLSELFGGIEINSAGFSGSTLIFRSLDSLALDFETGELRPVNGGGYWRYSSCGEQFYDNYADGGFCTAYDLVFPDS